MSFMRVIQHEPQTFQWWMEQASAGRLDLDPDFQRKSDIWSKFKKAHLIDSIINGFDIPKFYIADFTLGPSDLNKTKLPYAVVDGKQRFNAVFQFLRNEFPLNRSSLLESDDQVSLRGLTFAGLQRAHPTIAQRVLAFRPVVMSFTTDDPRKIFEMFVRLNSGEAANSAERRNAQPGPVPALVREIVSHPFFTNRVRFEVKRMAEYNLAAKLLLLEHHKNFVDVKASNLDRFVKNAATETTPSFLEEPTVEQLRAEARYESEKNAVVNTLETLSQAFQPRDPLLGAVGRIPIYYWVLRNYPHVVDDFRDFVGEFEAEVLGEMRRSRDGLPPSNDRLMVYYTHSRTTNDQASLRGRYEIMLHEMRRAMPVD